MRVRSILVHIALGLTLAGLPAAVFAQAPSRNPLFGGIPIGDASPQPLTLSLADVVSRALQYNMAALMANDNLARAKSAHVQASSDFLPKIDGLVSETRQKINLEAFGFPLPAGFPAIVGPFNVFDARLFLTQTVFSQQSLNDIRAEDHNIAAAGHARDRVRDLVALVAANTYLQTLAAAVRADAARAQVSTAEAIHAQATDLKQSGIAAGIDVLRAEVQLATERQRVTAASNDLEKSRLQLARLIGLPIGQTFTLSDQLPTVPAPDISLDAALTRAYESRPDYQEALERVRAAEASRQSAGGERWPSVVVNANFGDIGLTVAEAHTTFSVAAAVTVPIFNGETRGKMADADIELESRRHDADDLRAGIYYDVRMAFLDLQATREMLDVATKSRDLAAQQLVQARDRFAAGVASNIEVVQAQETVARANDQYIGALYGYNFAKGVLARDMGGAEEGLRLLLGGTR